LEDRTGRDRTGRDGTIRFLFCSQDKYVLFVDYLKEHGDPTTNGLGHKRMKFNCEDCVFVPGKKEWTVQRAHIEQARRIQSRADDALGAAGGDEDLSMTAFEDLGASLFAAYPQATGVSIDQLRASASSASASADTMPEMSHSDDEDSGGKCARVVAHASEFDVLVTPIR